MNKLKNRGPLVLAAAIVINFVCGLGYIWSIIAKQLIHQLGWTGVQASMPFTVFSIMFALSMLVLGPLQDKKGPRFLSTMGGLLIGGGLVLTGLFLYPSVILFTFGCCTGFGLGSMYASTVPPAMKWYPPQKRGTINGIIVATLALASMMYSPLAKTLMDRRGIADTFLVIGGSALVILVGFSQFLANPPEADGKAESPAASSEKEIDSRQMLRTGNFYKIWLMFALSAASSLMIVGHAANIALEQASWSGGFILVILLSLSNGAGRFLGGFLSDRLGQPRLMRLTFIIQGVNIFFFQIYQSPLLLALGVVLAGLCYGSTMVVFSAETASSYGMKNFGANYGKVYTAWGVGGVLGPLPSAMIFDATGSYTGAYIVSGVLVVIALGIAISYKQQKAPLPEAA